MATSNRTGNGGGPPNVPPINEGNANNPPGGFRGRRVTTCSFCGKSSRDVGPMVEGPSDVYICANCVDLAHNIIRQEKRKLSSAAPVLSTSPPPDRSKSSWTSTSSARTSPRKASPSPSTTTTNA